MRSSRDQFADVVMALAALALGTAVGLAPLALAGLPDDPFDFGASYVFWVLGGLGSAALVAGLDPHNFMRHGIAVGMGFPLGFLVLVARTPMTLPNLFPLTLVMLAFVGMAAALPGAALGRLLSPWIGDRSAEGRAGIGWALIAAGAVAVGVLVHRATLTMSAPPGSPLRVVDVTLRAEPADYSGPCPGLITFRGAIRTAGGRGRVSYRFTRSDGATAPVQTLDVDGASLREIQTTWMLGNQGAAFQGWQAIHILEPQPLTSAPARFQFRCAP